MQNSKVTLPAAGRQHLSAYEAVRLIHGDVSREQFEADVKHAASCARCHGMLTVVVALVTERVACLEALRSA